MWLHLVRLLQLGHLARADDTGHSVVVMTDPVKEAADLAKADEDIAAGEKRLADQISLIEELKYRGESTEEAEKVRHTFEEVLKVFRAHRQLIVDALKRI